ncbi:MAG: uL22 family ribosomal protein [Nanoarchaeota archaeon]|nr:uL22 family ribosomal protein [Nanoarchaeota archaeon]
MVEKIKENKMKKEEIKNEKIVEAKVENKEVKTETNKETKVEENKTDKKTEEKKTDDKKEGKKETPKKQEVKPKEIAIVQGISLRISPKYSWAICRAIKWKSTENAIAFLEDVIRKKKAVRMNNLEIGHRKGKGMMAGRYPLNASKEFILLLKQLKANASVNGIDNPVITLIKANRASRPHKREGKRGKRTHVYIEAKDRTKFNRERKGKK